MEKTYIESVDRYEISCDNHHYLHRIGSQEYPEIRRTRVAPDDVDNWEEIAVTDMPAYTEAEYNAKVVELIRERYSADEEFALQRKALHLMLTPATASTGEETEADTVTTTETVLDEFAAYNTYAKQCKARAKKEWKKG